MARTLQQTRHSSTQELMKPYYRDCTINDALLVAKNLLPEDRREMEGLGYNPLILPVLISDSDTAQCFFNEDGEIAGLGGIRPDHRPHVGQAYMLATPAIKKHPREFIRRATEWLSEQRKYRLLWNIACAENKFHHKLMRYWGFKGIQTIYQPPFYKPYIQVVKLCVPEQK